MPFCSFPSFLVDVFFGGGWLLMNAYMQDWMDGWKMDDLCLA